MDIIMKGPPGALKSASNFIEESVGVSCEFSGMEHKVDQIKYYNMAVFVNCIFLSPVSWLVRDAVSFFTQSYQI